MVPALDHFSDGRARLRPICSAEYRLARSRSSASPADSPTRRAAQDSGTTPAETQDDEGPLGIGGLLGLKRHDRNEVKRSEVTGTTPVAPPAEFVGVVAL
jgi:hypothetical protein